MILELFQLILSPIYDSWIFFQLQNRKLTKKDYLFIILFPLIIISVALYFINSNNGNGDYLVDTFELILFLLFYAFKQPLKEIKIVLSSVFSVLLIDLFATFITEFIAELVSLPNTYLTYGAAISIELLLAFAILKFKFKIRSLMTGTNSNIFLGLLIYIYLSSAVIYDFVYDDKYPAQVRSLILGVILIQAFLLCWRFIVLSESKEIFSLSKNKLS